jgi:hypothetical protein
MEPFIDPFMDPFIEPFIDALSIPFTTGFGRIGDDHDICRAGGSFKLILVPNGMLKLAPFWTCIYDAGIWRFPLACMDCIS